MMYPRRYEREPRKRKLYCLAFDYIEIYGYPRKVWKHEALKTLTPDEMREVWDTAQKDINGKSMINYIY